VKLATSTARAIAIVLQNKKKSDLEASNQSRNGGRGELQTLLVDTLKRASDSNQEDNDEREAAQERFDETKKNYDSKSNDRVESGENYKNAKNFYESARKKAKEEKERAKGGYKKAKEEMELAKTREEEAKQAYDKAEEEEEAAKKNTKWPRRKKTALMKKLEGIWKVIVGTWEAMLACCLPGSKDTSYSPMRPTRTSKKNAIS